MHVLHRTAITATVAIAVVLSSAGTGYASIPTDDPREAAAGWLTTQLTDGERITVQFGDDVFDSYGPTADVLLALAATGVAAGSIDAIGSWFAQPEVVAGYTGDGVEETYAGATGKLLVVAAATGRDGTDVGGRDLVAQLTGLRDADGRFRDDSAFGDFSSTLTQAFAVLGLHRADPTAVASEDVEFLLDQQCPDGGFRFEPDIAECTSHVDTTGLVVQALHATGGAAALAATADAVDWLVAVQENEGGFAGSPEPANANSTGLAALALAVGGADDEAEAARAWIIETLAQGCDDDEPGAIRAMVDDPGDLVLATAQAAWGLAGVSLADVSAAGAADVVPLLDCDPEEEPVEEPTEEPTGEPTGEMPVADTTEIDMTRVEAAATLPETGGPQGLLAALGGVLLGAGLLLLLAARRPRTA